MCVRPSVRMSQFGSHWMDFFFLVKFGIGDSLKFVEKLEIWLQSDSNIGQLTWNISTFYCCSNIKNLSLSEISGSHDSSEGTNSKRTRRSVTLYLHYLSLKVIVASSRDLISPWLLNKQQQILYAMLHKPFAIRQKMAIVVCCNLG